MFIEDYQKKDLPEKCNTFFEKLNEHILKQNYKERKEIHYFRDLYKSVKQGYSYTGGNIYYLICQSLKREFGKEKGLKIFLNLMKNDKKKGIHK